MGRPAVPDNSIPLAKISKPALRGIFRRQRLFDVLREGQSGAAIWISGPGGSGKTTLVASFLESEALPHVWFRVDEGDSDLATFFYHLGLAARSAGLRRQGPLPLLTAEYLAGLPTFSRRYFRDLYSRFDRPFAVVLDNYQMVPEASPLHQVVRIAIEEIPESGCVLIVSRQPPNEEFARFLALRSMAVIDNRDLALTVDETEAILRSWGHDEVSERQAREMHDKTEGWVAGLVLLQQQISAVGARLGSLGMPPRQAVFSYFAGEVFRKMDPPIRQFLLRTAFLPEMSVDMARRLTGLAEADQVLRDLNRRNYFTERHRSKANVYQYHSLFREFLLSTAENQLSEERFARARIDAAELLESVGHAEYAFDLFRSAGRVDRMATMAVTHGPAFMAQGRHAMLANWLDSLPEDLVAQDADLLFWRGISHMPLDPAFGRGLLEQALESYSVQGRAVGLWSSWAAIVDTFLYEWGDFRPLDRWIKVADDLHAEELSFPSREIEARLATGMVNALFFRQPDHPRLREWADRLDGLLFSLSDVSQQIVVGARLAQYFATIGEFAPARRLLRSLEPLARKPSTLPLARLTWFSVASIHEWLAADEAACTATVSEGLRISAETGVHVCDYFLLSQRVYGYLTVGNIEAAAEDLARMGDMLVEARRLDAALFHYLHSWKAGVEEDLSSASEHLKAALRNVLAAGVPFVEGVIRVALAQCAFDQGNSRDAAVHLRRARRIAGGMNSSHLKFMCLLAQAQIEVEQGKEKAGRKSLRSAFALGHEKEFLTFPWWRPSMMSRLCAKALEAGIDVDYVRTVIKERGLRPPLSATSLSEWPWPVKIYALGQFRVVLDGKELRFARKERQRPLELLKLLVALGGSQVPETRLADLLWPDSEGDAAERTFGITLYRLRQLLDRRPVIQRIGKRLTILAEECWVDAWEFERLADRLEQARSEALWEEYFGLARTTLELYRGSFLAAETAQAWAVTARERLRQEYVRLATTLGSETEKRHGVQEAALLYRRALASEPLAESLWRALISLYLRHGAQTEALAAYQQCGETFSAECGSAPPFRMESLARAAEA